MFVVAMTFLSAFCLVLVVCWRYLVPDALGRRVQTVMGNRNLKTGMGDAGKTLTLRKEPKQIFRELVQRFNLTSRIQDGKLVHKLRMAGYRGHAPVITYLGFLILTPVALLAIASFYLFVIFPNDQPLIVRIGIVLAAGYAGCHLPALYVKNRTVKRQKAIRRGWPDALDLMLICVESGMGIESTLRKVAHELSVQSPELAEEFVLTTAELSYLQDRRQAFENLAARTGLDVVKAVVTCLVQTEKYGTPLGQALRVLAQESRDMRMAEAEKKAASLPPKLTVPMIIFFLPVLFAVIITPAIIQHLSN